MLHVPGCLFIYNAAFNAPCVGHKDDELQAQFDHESQKKCFQFLLA